jgi:hypothetical protein
LYNAKEIAVAYGFNVQIYPSQNKILYSVFKYKVILCQVLWFTPIILSMREEEIRQMTI